MASPVQTLGPFFNAAGEVTPAGAVYFLNPETDVPKEIYVDSSLTIPAANPVILDSAGKYPDQLFFGVGQYKLVQYELIDSDIGTPVFPDDYSLVREWVDGSDSSSGGLPQISSEFTIVETIQQLTDNVDPSVYGVAEVIGYYSKEDQIDTRTYYWDSTSVLASDGGSVLSSTLVGSGRWILKTQSDVIDVRWFGALPNSGISSNSGLTSAAAFAASSQLSSKEVFIPSGSYEFSAGTINISASLKIAKGVFFFIPAAGDLILNIQNRFDIRIDQDPLVPSSLGQVIFDFRTNSTALTYYDLIKPIWFKNQDNCFQYSGSNPILISEPISVELSANASANLVFTNSGKITLDGTKTLNVLKCKSDDNSRSIFAYNYGGFTLLSFDSGVDLFSGWFSDLDDLKFAGKTNCTLFVNTDRTLLTGYSLNLSSLKGVYSEGSSFAMGDSSSLTLPNNLSGKVVGFNSSNASVVVGESNYNSMNFKLNSNASVVGFIKSAANDGAVATFNNEVLSGTYDLTLSGLSEIEIHNLRIGAAGSFLVDTKLILKECSIKSSVVLTSADVFIYDSLLVPVAAATANILEAYNSEVDGTISITTRFKAFDSYLYGQITSTNTEVKLCSIFAEMIPIPASGAWSFVISDNVFNGGYIKPNGTATSLRGLIERNDFRFPSGEDPNTFLYVPIQDDNFVLTDEAFSSSNPFYAGSRVAYNLRVAENSPAINIQLTASPTNGTLVKQTKFEIKNNDYGITSIGIKNAIGSDVVLCPAVSDKMIFNSAIATSSVDTDGTEAAKISSDGYIREINPSQFVLKFENDGSVTEVGASVIIDLYPFKGN